MILGHNKSVYYTLREPDRRLFVVDCHIHVDDAENRVDFAIETDSPTNLARRMF